VAVVDICNLVQSLAVDIIGDTTFGQSFHVVENGSHPLPLKLKQAMMMSGLFQFIPWLKAVPGIPLRPAYIGQFTNEIVQNRRAVIASAPRKDLLQMLVEAVDDAPTSTFRSSDLQDEVVVLLTAGSETTANAELFVILLLTKHPEKMAKLQAEIDRFYPDAEQETNADHMPEMHYLQACIDETMRLYPAQPTGSPRESPQDINILGYQIPRGTAIFPTTVTVQRDPALWDQPDAFIPERWLDSSTASRVTPVPFYPFAAGSRVCIGKNFAMQEMYLSLVGLFRRFEVRYIKGQDEGTMLRVAQQLRAGKYLVELKRRG
jgi:cytochrome P450